MSISHRILGLVFVVGLLAGSSASSLAAVIVTSGTGTTYAFARGSYNLPGVYVGSVSGSDSFDIPLPGGGTHTTSFSTSNLLPPEVSSDEGIAGGGGTGKLTVSTLLGGLTGSGRATAYTSSILGVGGGSGNASVSLDVFFTVSNSPAVLNLKTAGASSTYGFATFALDFNGSSLISYPPGFEYDLHMALNPGDYHWTFSIKSFGGTTGESPVTFQASIVPEIPSAAMMACAFAMGGVIIIRKRWHSITH